MNLKKRITYLDMAKGAGIVLMVAGHLIGSVQTIDYKPYFSPTYHVIASFHMPLFFIISGILLRITQEERKEMGHIIYRKAKGLLLPYATFSLIYMVINICTCIFQPELLEFPDLWKFFIYSVTLRGVSVLWFLPTLFFGEILFLWVRKRTSERKTAASFAVTGLLIFYFSPILSWEGWEHNLGLMTVGSLLHMAVRSVLSCTFLLIGYESAHFFQRRQERSVLGFAAGAALLILNGFLCFLNGDVDLNFMVFDNFLLYTLCACIGSFGVILICKHMYCSRLLLFFGTNSLVIMATHMEFKVMMDSIRFSYWLNQYVTRAKEWVLFLTMAVFITVVEAGIVFLYNHYLYFLIGKEKPERTRQTHGRTKSEQVSSF